MQVLAGDILSAQQSYWHYFGLWQLFGALPERFLYPQGHLHPNQQQYPLRPELLESTFYLYQVSWHGTVGDGTAFMLHDNTSTTGFVAKTMLRMNKQC